LDSFQKNNLERKMLMLTIGDKFPAFKLLGVVSLDKGKEFAEVSSEGQPGRWKVVFFWPKDFTFVCPTEIAAFGKQYKEFQDRDTDVFGVSHDNEYVHLAWRRTHPDLKDLPYPMLADVKQELTSATGVIHKAEGVPLRATFIIDPEGIIRHVSVNDLNVGRSVDEILRLLDGFQTDELCPCNWRPGEKTLEAA
jgi:alkyl hydroperoxide reductase subunit AhpC